MGVERKMTVSNSGPLIHLAKIDRLVLLRELFGTITIPEEVKVEVVDNGKDEGAPDAFLVEDAVENGWIVIERSRSDRVKEIADKVGIDAGEVAAIMLARKLNCPVLLDDLAARRFATGLGLEVAGSIGILIRCAKTGLLSENEALESLEKLARTMWLGMDVYEDARKCIEGLFR